MRHELTAPGGQTLAPAGVASARAWAAPLAMAGAVFAVAVVRVRLCFTLPVNSGDLVRHIVYGAVVGEHGPAWAAVPLGRVHPGYAWIAWSDVPYNYPVVALAFWTAVAAASQSLWAAKLTLTAIEGVNAILVARLTGSRWLGVLYWAYPMSIWWVSREGQFEPVQSSLALLALLALRRSPAAACALLGLAVQTKVTAVFLLPLLLWRAASVGRRALVVASAAFVVSLLPTLLAPYPSVEQVLWYGGLIRTNPYTWNFLDPSWFGWNPSWMIVGNELASYGLVVALAVALARSSAGRLSYLAPLAFAVLLKIHGCVQYWYWVATPIFLVPIADRRVRTVVLLALPLLDLYSIVELVAGPFGYTVGNYYGR